MHLDLIAIVHAASGSSIRTAIDAVLPTSHANRCRGINAANRDFIRSHYRRQSHIGLICKAKRIRGGIGWRGGERWAINRGLTVIGSSITKLTNLIIPPTFHLTGY